MTKKNINITSVVMISKYSKHKFNYVKKCLESWLSTGLKVYLVCSDYEKHYKEIPKDVIIIPTRRRYCTANFNIWSNRCVQLNIALRGKQSDYTLFVDDDIIYKDTAVFTSVRNRLVLRIPEDKARIIYTFSLFREGTRSDKKELRFCKCGDLCSRGGAILLIKNSTARAIYDSYCMKPDLFEDLMMIVKSTALDKNDPIYIKQNSILACDIPQYKSLASYITDETKKKIKTRLREDCIDTTVRCGDGRYVALRTKSHNLLAAILERLS